MKEPKRLDWKETLFKSIIYRIITVVLGFTTSLIITGDIAIAIGVASLTEIVQFLNYFLFEMIWNKVRTEKIIEEELKKRTIDLKINYSTIPELAYEVSKTNTFIKEVYESAVNFFKSLLENEELMDYHDEINKYYEMLQITHKDRDFSQG